MDFLGESEGSLPQPHDSLPDAGEAINDFWSMSGNFIYRHHVEPRVKLYSPRDESFPIPLKYIDVYRTTHTNLDVKQEKRIDDYWNIDGSRDLSDPWTGFTQFTQLDEKAPDGYTWSGGRLTRKQLTSRPDHLWPEVWKSMGKNAKLKEKQKWSEEKIHLENARKLRGIYFIDPEDKEFKETIKMEDPVVPLERNLYGHPLAGLLWERQFEKILLKHVWEKLQIGNVSLFIVKKDYSYLCMWMTSNWLERSKILIRCGKYSTKKSIWENQHLSWIMYT